MTGPARGKVDLRADVYVYPLSTEDMQYLSGVTVYGHLKGYARASVTHIDIEGEVGEIIKLFGLDEADKRFVEIEAIGDALEVRHKSRDAGLLIEAGLKDIDFGDAKCRGILGYKDNEGVFLGLCREIINKLEPALRKLVEGE